MPVEKINDYAVAASKQKVKQTAGGVVQQDDPVVIVAP